MRLVLRSRLARWGRAGILGAPWSQAEVLGSGDQVQVLKDSTGRSVVTGVEARRERSRRCLWNNPGERWWEWGCTLSFLLKCWHQVGGNQAVSSILQPVHTESAQGHWVPYAPSMP